MRQLEAILRGSLGFDIVLWILMALFLFWDILMSGRPFWRHMVQLCCCCCGIRWVIRHVSPLWCPENYWVHVIVSLKQDASTLRMLSEFWRVNPTRGVTSDHALSLSTISEQTTSIRGGYFAENYKWGHPRHLGNFYAIHKKSVSVRKKTRPPLTLFITCYQIKNRGCCKNIVLGLNQIFSCEAQLNKCTCVSVCPFQNVISPAYDSFW